MAMEPTRTATVRTAHEDPGTIAAAVVPDNTADMETRVEAGTVVTTIERGDAGGLQSTVDDYVVNVDVADAVAVHAVAFRRRTIEDGRDGHRTSKTGRKVHRTSEDGPSEKQTSEHRREGTDTNG